MTPRTPRSGDATTGRSDLVERVRARFAPGADVRVVSMFGARAFMLDGSMVVAARSGGSLLVRIDPARYDELVARPGASQAHMGRDRTMGPGWIEVDPAALERDDDLASWIDVALEHHRARAGA